MFKSMFSKYLTAFIIIIVLSLLMLSGIITSMIQGYALSEREDDLVLISEGISSYLISSNVENIENYPESFLTMLVTPLITLDSGLDIIITDESGNVILTTVGTVLEDGKRDPITDGDLGTVNLSLFTEITDEEGRNYKVHHGNLAETLKKTSIACAKEIITSGTVRGYAIAVTPTADDDSLIGIARRAVVNSSAWVMLAAVIAVYFITERIIHPLRSMTDAAKKFASGDFSTRVSVYGQDEVSELANAFNNMAESLEKLETMRSSFLASVSHDLRTPMTTIAGFIDGINSGAIPKEKHEYYLGVISAEVHRLSRLVSQLLDVSRLESGDRKFDFVDFDVAELSRIILLSFEQQIEEKKLDVEFDSENDQMFVNADKDAIHQVIYNLCHNAIKFSCEKGKFRIKIFRADKKIRVSVFDEGQTIPKEDLGMIFERFYKSDKSRGLDRTGVGLGLYICKTIIDAHSQEIHVESDEESGTEFWFTLREGENIRRKN